MAAGIAVGLGSSVWAQRKVKAVARRYSPVGVAGGAASRVRTLPGELKAAVREGRAAMREREAELRGATRPVDMRGKQ